jgi:monoamine oxidase
MDMSDNEKKQVRRPYAGPASPSRRGFLTAGAGASVLAASAGTLATSAAVAGEHKGKSKGHVIVIGGGFAGCTASRELSRSGYKVTLLEARNRLGGRTFTSEFAGEMVDMGGTWIHWAQPHVWSEIRRYGMELDETVGAVAENVIYIDYEGKRHEAKWSDIWPTAEDHDKIWRKYYPGAYEMMPFPSMPFQDLKWAELDNVTMQERMDTADLTEIEKIYLDCYHTTCGANAMDQVSYAYILRWYAHAGYSGTCINDLGLRFKIKGGTKALLDKIIGDAKADIHLSTPVRKVTQTKNGVEVLTDTDKKFKADAVVCAMPQNVLRDVEFSPALPVGKQKASEDTHAGSGTKMHVQLEGEYEAFGGWAPGGDVPINYVLWDSVKNGHTHLITFGPSTDTLDMNDTEAVEKAIRTFLPDAKVIQAYGYGWNDDPYSQGVWFSPRPGQAYGILKDMQSSHGNIHFASGDWANSWRGFIDGAIEQGLVAADKVRDQLKG